MDKEARNALAMACYGLGDKEEPARSPPIPVGDAPYRLAARRIHGTRNRPVAARLVQIPLGKACKVPDNLPAAVKRALCESREERLQAYFHDADRKGTIQAAEKLSDGALIPT